MSRCDREKYLPSQKLFTEVVIETRCVKHIVLLNATSQKAIAQNDIVYDCFEMQFQPKIYLNPFMVERYTQGVARQNSTQGNLSIVPLLYKSSEDT